MKQTKKLNQAGFSIILLALILLVTAGAGVTGWMVYSEQQETAKNKAAIQAQQEAEKSANKFKSEGQISLRNLGLISLDSILVTPTAVEDHPSKVIKGFYAFGDKLSAGKYNANFAFASLKDDAKVVASIDGVITQIRQQPDSTDYEVFLQPQDGSKWTISYDHIVNLTIKQGDRIVAGNYIGEPHVQSNGLKGFELQINEEKDGVTTHYCPANLLSANVREKILGELSAMQTSWETATGKDLYDLTVQEPVGCIKKTMSPAEAEGR